MVRGRPRNPEQQKITRDALMNAARHLLTEKSYDRISIRELAAEAGTQSAMVSYYFGSKEGLFIALLSEAGDIRSSLLNRLMSRMQQQPETVVSTLAENMLDLIAGEPWLVHLVRSDVLNRDSQLRQHFMEAIPDRMRTGAEQLFRTLQSVNVIRRDLDPAFMAASVASLVLFPFIAEPIVSRAFGLDTNTLQSPAWKTHLTTFLQSALQPQETSS